MAKAFKKRVSKNDYMSPRQLTFTDFESTFDRHLPKDNRWVQLTSSIPWDEIFCVYERQLNNAKTWSSNIKPRVVTGTLMVKLLLNTSDRHTIIAIQEKIDIHYFLGFDTMIFEAPINASLFVEIRKQMGVENLEKINDLIYKHSVLQMNKSSGSA